MSFNNSKTNFVPYQEDFKRKDVLENINRKVSIYDNKGFAILEDCMPRLIPTSKNSMDYAIAQMARISMTTSIEKERDSKDDDRLVDYLIENYHTSPLEGIKFKFIVQMPIYVARQLIRHRTAQLNEYSMRYSEALDSFYFPELRIQDTVNKQGSIESDDFKLDIQQVYEESKDICTKTLFEKYKKLIEGGVAKEVARSILPVSEMTKMVYCMDLHNLFKMLRLRMDEHAQKEIRILAEAMYALIKQVVPKACDSFENHWFENMTLSRDEQLYISSNGKENKLKARQLNQLKEKLSKLNLKV